MNVHFVLNTSAKRMISMGVTIGCVSISPSCSSTSSDFAMQRFDRDSEVYKMIQENKESRAAPRQSNTFKMLQEVLEADERGEEQVIIRKIVFT